MKRTLLAAAFALIALPAAAEPLPLATLSNYLNTLGEVQATFKQENADGTQSSGEVFLHRPGRMRLQYDPPEGSVVIAAGGTVSIFDAKSNEPPEQYPLFKTPLNLILAPQIDLSAAKMVVGLGEVKGLTHVVAQDPKNPDYGTIELIFAPAPVRLTGWIVTDDMGNQTVVKLGDFTGGQSFPASTFSVEIEAANRKKG
jgi:outer membrane lipoprotein-sorting protein